MLPFASASGSKISPPRVRISAVGIAVFLVCLGLGIPAAARSHNPAPGVAAFAIGLYFLFAIRVAEQWERAAVLRLGRYIGLRGPGLFMIVPVIDRVTRFVVQGIPVSEAK